MGTERIILCGGAKPAGGTGTSQPLKLDLWQRGTGFDVTLKIADLNQRLEANVPAAFHDLVEIATYVWTADQAVGRGGNPKVKDVDTFGEKWRRTFEFHVPVRRPDLWNSPQVKRALESTLGFLSDDTYGFTFYPATDAPAFQMYLKLGTDEATRGAVQQVMLFSGGLDSLSGGIEETVVQKRRSLWVSHRPTPKHNRRHREIGQLMAEKAGALRPSHVLVDIFKDRTLNKEPTQRSRSFLFASLGAAVARMVGLNSVRFYENGVVSLNLPMAEQLVGARATRTTHPRVLAGFQALMSLLGEGDFKVENPLLWETKGEIVQRILKAGCGPMITPSVSCAHTWEASLEFPHCGTCSQCLDRRFGIVAAGAESFDPQKNYKLDIFTKARPKDEDKILGAAYLDRAHEFGGMTGWPDLVARFPEVADVLSYLNMPKANGAAKILDLHKRHAAEITKVSRELLARYAADIFDHRLDDDCLVRTMYESRGLPSPPVDTGAKGEVAGVEAGKANGKFSFRDAGGHYEVVFEGRPRFTVPNTLGTKYVDHLMHNPNQAVHVLELERTIRADKESARAPGSKQTPQDGQAKREVQRELLALEQELQEAEEADNPDAVKRLKAEIRTVQAADKNQAGITADAGERARNNVRKAVAAVIRKLRRGNTHQKAFAVHLHQCIKLGYEVLYNQAGGDGWD